MSSTSWTVAVSNMEGITIFGMMYLRIGINPELDGGLEHVKNVPSYMGYLILPIDFHSMIFQMAQPPTSHPAIDH